MKGELIHMADHRKSEEVPLPPMPSVNTQLVVGVVCTGLVVLGIHRKLRIITDNQKVIHDSILALGNQAIDAKDIINFVARSAATTAPTG